MYFICSIHIIHYLWINRSSVIYFPLFLFQHDSIQAIAFNRDVTYVHDKLQLYETYYIANATLTDITDPRNQTGSIPQQITLTMSVFIRKLDKKNALQWIDNFPLTSFWSLDQYKNSDANRFSIKHHYYQICYYIILY